MRKLRSAYPCPWALVRSLTSMPSRVIRRSVPWSRFTPRRKYWFALPSPLCWVTTRPGVVSSNSPGSYVTCCFRLFSGDDPLARGVGRTRRVLRRFCHFDYSQGLDIIRRPCSPCEPQARP